MEPKEDKINHQIPDGVHVPSIEFLVDSMNDELWMHFWLLLNPFIVIFMHLPKEEGNIQIDQTLHDSASNANQFFTRFDGPDKHCHQTDKRSIPIFSNMIAIRRQKQMCQMMQ